MLSNPRVVHLPVPNQQGCQGEQQQPDWEHDRYHSSLKNVGALTTHDNIRCLSGPAEVIEYESH